MRNEMDELIESLDHMSPEFARDPWNTMRALREQCPVAHSSARGGFWVVSTYEDLCEIARDEATWTSTQGILVDGPGPIRNIPVEVDPPEFYKYRRFLNPLFAPQAISRREGEVRALANTLIDDVIEAGECDIHHALAQPLPAIMTYRLLGLPEEEALSFVQSFEHATSGTVPVAEQYTTDDGAGTLAQFSVVMETIQARRAEARDDIISYLVHNEIDGKRLDDTELMGLIVSILSGGMLTTTDAIGNALVYLQEHPEDRDRLIQDRALIPTAVEELLRYEAPVMGLCRTATRDVEVGGRQIAEGEKVLLLWASANRDPDEFPDPDRCIIDRTPNRHVSFGVGIHRCLGSNLGRLELRVALEEVLRRMPRYEIDLDGVVMAPVVGITYGRIRIPMTFPIGDREG
jgi:cytochrome P450